jgi:N-acetylglucosamine kinase-like BadF-type ATPase
MSDNFFLGVDGGGTKTRFILVDGDGKLAAAYEGPTSDHLQVGIDGVRDVLAGGVAALFREAGMDGSSIAYAFFGLPAYGEDSAAQVLLDGLPEPLLGHRRYRCGNDMICAWAGSLGGEDGINIVAGTGSIGYGQRKGRSARAGGWGEIFGDEGSGYWIGVQGLNAWSRMSDGRRPAGPLLALLRDQLELADDTDLIDLVLNRWRGRRADIAALAPTIVAAADAGDDACRDILQRAGAEMALLATTARHALGASESARVPVSYVGGVFTSPAVLHAFSAELDRASGVDLQAPRLTPDLGAAVHAAQLAGYPLSRAAITRLHDNGP